MPFSRKKRAFFLEYFLNIIRSNIQLSPNLNIKINVNHKVVRTANKPQWSVLSDTPYPAT